MASGPTLALTGPRSGPKQDQGQGQTGEPDSIRQRTGRQNSDRGDKGGNSEAQKSDNKLDAHSSDTKFRPPKPRSGPDMDQTKVSPHQGVSNGQSERKSSGGAHHGKEQWLLALEECPGTEGAVQKGVSTYEQHRESVLMDVDDSTDCEESGHEVNSDNFDRSEPIVIENREGREINTDKELPEHDAPDRGHSVGGTVTAQTPQKAEQEDPKGMTDTSDYDREFPKLETSEQTLMRLQGDRMRHSSDSECSDSS